MIRHFTGMPILFLCAIKHFLQVFTKSVYKDLAFWLSTHSITVIQLVTNCKRQEHPALNPCWFGLWEAEVSFSKPMSSWVMCERQNYPSLNPRCPGLWARDRNALFSTHVVLDCVQVVMKMFIQIIRCKLSNCNLQYSKVQQLQIPNLQ